MITEKELERALELRKEINDCKAKINKFEDIKVSRTEIGSSFSIDNNRVETDEYTIATLRRFKRDILKSYNKKLEDLRHEYSSIITTEEDAFEKLIFGDDED